MKWIFLFIIFYSGAAHSQNGRVMNDTLILNNGQKYYKGQTIDIGKGLFRFNYRYLVNVECVCRFTIKLTVKDSKYRLQIYDMIIEQGEKRTPSTMEEINEDAKKNYNRKIIAEVTTNVNDIIASVRKAMTSKADSDF